ncbi:fumarate reductase subunit FrdD [Aliivibrio finisterrensis]|jgi:fumarate reductase subunit D|uniref:Fumarate reductase subunit D n=1 Tax=Aliivibrio finisterrensis TaxID=511998 RepID=A0A4Q5KER4_9GAMM|nr:fumarate reductase subunit FrdD [Aliivibrio finisterrensis]RYU50570.1 fumarate reductase subunit FrdD [Aliivibrio finisterrensis]RYU52190.1 fumarate reductase subunit FrdD [Aliivibrio finisterrensis]RYU57252.1 fumarate reductase subunit FrdD [Aliivibrio finisterrensis]RYU63663.1 fumarate reductase subunit FrdD [Aliivibrio finisterrensis]
MGSSCCNHTTCIGYRLRRIIVVNLNPKRSDEPVWWGLFGAGGTWFAMLTPVTILVLGILVPLGVIGPESMNYLRVAGFVTSIIGALFVIGSISMPMWHAMHRLHHGMHDLKFHTGTAGKIACYAAAALATVLSVVFIFMI